MKNSNPVDSLPVFFFLTFFITDAFILYLICIYYIHTIVDIIVPRVRQIYSSHWTNMFGEAVCLCVACCQADNAGLCLYLCEKKILRCSASIAIITMAISISTQWFAIRYCLASICPDQPIIRMCTLFVWHQYIQCSLYM